MAEVSPCERVWWCHISHCLAPGAKGLKGKNEEEIGAVNEPQLHKSAQQGETNLNKCYYSAVAASYILSCFSLVKDQWLLGWQPTLQYVWLLTR